MEGVFNQFTICPNSFPNMKERFPQEMFLDNKIAVYPSNIFLGQTFFGETTFEGANQHLH